jgi:hypothetical protein
MNLERDSVTQIIDKHYTLRCPHCNNSSNLTAISLPHYPSLMRYKVKRVGLVYKCDACNEPIFLKFLVIRYEPLSYFIEISDTYETVENSIETFEFEFLPENVKNDFSEALKCYSISAYNAFASMCRRSIQSAAMELGTVGKDKVQKQIEEMKEMAHIDEDTYSVLKQIIIDGHDGAHPHLPQLSPSRSNILLELMKDVMYQLFVRKGKLAKAAELRKQQILNNKSNGV